MQFVCSTLCGYANTSERATKEITLFEVQPNKVVPLSADRGRVETLSYSNSTLSGYKKMWATYSHIICVYSHHPRRNLSPAVNVTIDTQKKRNLKKICQWYEYFKRMKLLSGTRMCIFFYDFHLLFQLFMRTHINWSSQCRFSVWYILMCTNAWLLGVTFLNDEASSVKS